MAVNPISLKNLIPGAKKGTRAMLTKEFAKEAINYLHTNQKQFIARMERLSDRDFVAAYLKFAELVLPKKQDLTIESDTTVTQDWTIQVVPTPTQQVQIDEIKQLNIPTTFEPIVDTDTEAKEVEDGD